MPSIPSYYLLENIENSKRDSKSKTTNTLTTVNFLPKYPAQLPTTTAVQSGGCAFKIALLPVQPWWAQHDQQFHQ